MGGFFFGTKGQAGSAGKDDAKPSLKELESLSHSHFFPYGYWAVVAKRQGGETANGAIKKEDGSLKYYDLYSDFGPALGTHPKIKDKEINKLSVKIMPLLGGEFYHYGTTREMISSTMAIQNKVCDQRLIMHRKINLTLLSLRKTLISASLSLRKTITYGLRTLALEADGASLRIT